MQTRSFDLPKTKSSKPNSFLAGLKHAFALDSPLGPLDEQDDALLGRLAGIIVARRMALPATLFLRSVTPLNTIGSQAMVFLRPFLTGLFFNPEQYDRLSGILERREGLAALVEAVEAAEAARKGTTL